MGSSTPRAAARPSLRFVRLAAAAAAGLSEREAPAAEIPVDPPPIVTRPPLGTRPPVPPPSRTGHIQSSYQTWLSFTAAGPLADPLAVFVDLGGGFYEDMHPAGVTVRPGVGVKLPLGFSIFAGYAYSSFWSPKHERGEEQSAFQQVGFAAPTTAVELSARLRWEERFRAGSGVAYRLRTLVEVDVPLGRRSPWRIVLWDEIFFGLNQPADWQPTVLDLDMFFAGVAWTPNRHFRADAGYQGAVAPRKAETELVHCLSLSSTVSW